MFLESMRDARVGRQSVFVNDTFRVWRVVVRYCWTTADQYVYQVKQTNNIREGRDKINVSAGLS